MFPVFLAIAAMVAAPCAFAQGTAFTYQGQLDDSGMVADGLYDMQFSVWDQSSGGAQVSSTITYLGLPVEGGLFTAKFEFESGVFTGASRWLEIGVQTNGGGGFTTLAPRTEFTSVPRAILADTAFGVPFNTIKSEEVFDNSLTSADLAPNSVGTSEVIDNSLLAVDLAPGSVAGSEVLDNSLTANDLAANSVGASEIASSAVGQSEIATGGVASPEVLDGSLTTADLNLASVDARYVEVAGDTMTSSLSLVSAGNDADLIIENQYPFITLNRNLASGNNGIIFEENGANLGFLMLEGADGSIHLTTGTTGFGDDLVIMPSGFVGIGTDNPDCGLEVAGAGIWNSSIGIRDTTSGQDWRMAVQGTDFHITKVAGSTFTPVKISATGTSNTLVIDDSKVGIGKLAPSATLDVKGANTNDTSDALVVYNSAGTDLFHIENSGQVGVGNSSPMARLMVTGDGVDPALRVQNGGSTRFSVNANGGATIGTFDLTGSPANGLFVSGGVRVGAPDLPAGYKMSVDGKIICEEVLVQDSGSWPDYVFADDYNLRPLSEVEAHIRSDRRLPGIPDAGTVAVEGISVGQMQKQMMEKIEELTLYIIEQDKRIAELESRMGE
jgi:hypothetical protein